ncbi:MAG: hypothetical protein IJX74_00360 [Clostridia bacterium]|nr:hypothetical protein [Clostridia bacterium]
MRMRLEGGRILSLILCLLIIFSSLPAASASTSEADGAADVLHTVYPSQLLEQLAGEVSDAEADFVDGEMDAALISKFTVKYSEAALLDALDVQVVESEDKITVCITAPTQNRSGLCWIPVSARVSIGDTEVEVALDGGNGEAVLPKAADAFAVTASVDYQAKVAYTREDAETLANAAYNAGKTAVAALAQYESDLAEYNEKQAAYEKYLSALAIYESELKKYNAYLDAVKQYNADLKEYESYLASLEVYQKKLAEYQLYLSEYDEYKAAYDEYLDFLANPEKYENAYRSYLEYCEKQELIAKQLTNLDTIFEKDVVGNILYITLIEDNVAAVIKNKDALVSTGCDEQEVDNADRATKALQKLFTDYAELKKTRDKYEYYIANYTKIRDNVTQLYTSLSNLYTNDAVPSILEAKGKLERYWQFVGQLYVLHCALDDSVSFNPNWNIAGGYPKELLDPLQIPEDTNSAAPLAAFPTEISEVKNPALIQKPTPPTEVKKPIAPITVNQPTKPTEVIKPNYPTAAEYPGEKPTKPIFSAAVSAFAKAVQSGELKKRAVANEDLSVINTCVERAVSLDGYVAVGFYEEGSASLSLVKCVRSGEAIALPQPQENIFSDREYTYTFDFWLMPDGSRADDEIIFESDTCLRAAYTRGTRQYTVTWRIGDKSVTSYHVYGEQPTFDGVLPIPQSAEFNYSFTGWTPSPVPVTADAEYTAQFTATPKKYTVTWMVGENSYSQEYLYGDMPSFADTDALTEEAARLIKASGGKYIYHFVGWDKNISAVSANITYTAVYASVDIIPDLNEAMDVSISSNSSTVYVDIISDTADFSAQLDVSHVLEQAKGKSLVIRIDGISLCFASADVTNIRRAAAKYLKIACEKNSISVDVLTIAEISLGSYVGATVTFTDDGAAGEPVLLGDGEPCEFELTDDKDICFVLRLGKEYELYRRFKISVDEVDGGECVVLSESFAAAGDKIELELLARRGYSIGALLVLTSDGKSITVEVADGKYYFIMPESNVTVTPSFEKMKYTVKFISDGQIIYEDEYFYGDTVAVPKDVTKPDDGEFTYAFAGWDSPVRTVDGDAVYTAVFLSSPILDNDSVPVATLGLLEMGLIAGASATVSAGAMLCVFFMRRRKNRTQRVGNGSN